MVYDPCGAGRLPLAACMTNDVCTKRYPMAFTAITEVNDTEYPQHRRRSPLDGGHTAQLAGRAGGGPVQIDNRWIVPYNPSSVAPWTATSTWKSSSTPSRV